MTLPLKVKIYIALIILLSVVTMGLMVFVNNGHPINLQLILFWSALAVITESLVLRLPSGMGLSVSHAIVLAALIAQGPLAGTIVTGASFLFRTIRVPATNKLAHLFNTPVYKTLFNAAQGIMAIGIAGVAYTVLGGKPGEFNIYLTLLVTILYTILNSLIMSIFFALLKKQSFFYVWLSNMKGILINVVLVGSMGIIIFLAYASYGIAAVLLFLGPLLLARFTFKQYTDLRETYLDTIKAFNKLTEAKDTYTGEHASRVETYAVELARYINLPENRIENIRMAALLHDIGKIGISDLVLKKTSALTDSEYEQIKQHPTIGADIIQNVHFLKDVSAIIRHHHERFDGKGYPDHLVGEKISTESAILALADVYDAITSNRSYRTPLTLEDAIHEITKNSGTQFNPKLTEKFADLIRKKSEVFDRSAS
jgi:putative nucleotidyltransferase with HDIG domain